MNLLLTLLAILFIVLFLEINADTAWHFGEDVKKNVIIVHNSGHIKRYHKVTKVPLLTGISCMDLVYVRVLVHNSMGTPAVKFNADTNTVDIVYKLPQRSKSTYEIVSKGTPTHNCEEEHYKKEIKKRKSKKGNDKKRKDKKKKNKKKQDKHDYLLGIPDDDSTNTSQHDSNYEDSECDKITDFDDRKSKDSDENKKKYKKNDKNEDFDENKIKNSTEDKTKVSNEDKKADENSEDMDKDFGKKGTDEQKFQKKLRNRHRLKF